MSASHPISIGSRPRRNTISSSHSLGSSSDGIAASAPINITGKGKRRPTLSAEQMDPLFVNAMIHPSVPRTSMQNFSYRETSSTATTTTNFYKPYDTLHDANNNSSMKTTTNSNQKTKKDPFGKKEPAIKSSNKPPSVKEKIQPLNRGRSSSSSLHYPPSGGHRHPPSISGSVSHSVAGGSGLASPQTGNQGGGTMPSMMNTGGSIIVGSVGNVPANIHPEIGRLGLLIAHHKITGSNARCIAMLEAFKKVIADYESPSHMTLNRHLDSHLKPMINYLVNCRPLSVSMGNAIRHLKYEIANIPHDYSENASKAHLFGIIDSYIRDRIHLADQLICQHAAAKIQNDDVILVYSKSSVVVQLLVHAKKHEKKAFRVIVVDSRPWLEGYQTMETLTAADIPVTYLFINALGAVIKHVSKIIVGAHSIYSNGTMLARVGTCLVAMTGYDHHIPVIACCETYKFSDKVQLESYAFEETADPKMLIPPLETEAGTLYHQSIEHDNKVALKELNAKFSAVPGASKKSQQKGILSHGSQPDSKELVASSAVPHFWNIVHDITPSKYINMIITEIGMIPCTSVPVVLREYRPFSSF